MATATNDKTADREAWEPIVGPASGTPEWLAARRKLLTATDAAAICGRSAYKTPRHVFEEKTGRLAPFEGNQFTRRGTRYEPAIASDYAETAGVELQYPLPLLIHPKIEYLAATPDARIIGRRKGVEIKFSMSAAVASELGDEGTDWVPETWLLQSQQQMDVAGWTEIDVAVLLYGRLRIYTVERSNDLIECIHSAAAEMHQRIIDDNPPEPTWTHPKTPELIKALYGVREGAVHQLTADAISQWSEYRALGEEIKALEKRRELAKSRVLLEMAESAIGELGDGRELCRSVVERKEYVCKATSFVQLRERKAR